MFEDEFIGTDIAYIWMHMSYLSRRIRTASQAKILRVGELAAAAEAREREAWAEVLPPILPLDFDPCFLHVSSNFLNMTSQYITFQAWNCVSYVTENPKSQKTRGRHGTRAAGAGGAGDSSQTHWFLGNGHVHWTWSLHSCFDLFCQFDTAWVLVQSVIAWDFLRVSWSSPSMPPVLIQNYDSNSFIADP